MKQISLIVAAALIGGCAVGPDFRTPDAPKAASYGKQAVADADAPALREGAGIPGDWWQLFESEPLNALIREGLKNSPTLAAARARLTSMQQTLSADTGSMLYPSIDANLDSARRKISGATFGRPGNGAMFNVHTASVSVAYSIDAFGGGRRYVEYDEAKVDYEALQLEAARNTLIANIITAAINEASLREQVRAQGAVIEAQAHQVELARQRYEAGAIARSVLLAQQSALAKSRTTLPALEKQLASARHQLAALAGRFPGEVGLPTIELAQLTMPRELPLSLPSALTRQRPDIRAAEAELHQQSALVGVATANLYPKLSLNADFGTEATRYASLFNAGTAVWGLGAGLVQPIFRGGELRAKKRAAEADFERSAALYRQSVLEAFRDVADVLQALDSDAAALRLQQRTADLADETLKLVEQQYEVGAVSHIDLLDAQRSQQEACIGVIQARATLLGDSAALMYALGGGWWNRDASAEQVTSAETRIAESVNTQETKE